MTWLMLGVGREDNALVMDLRGALGDVQGMVGDALEFGNGVEIFGNVGVLLTGHLLTGDADQIGAQAVLVTVAVVLQLFHVLQTLRVKVGHKAEGFVQGFPGAEGHIVDGQTALLHGQGRVGDEALLQPDEEFVGGLGLLGDEGGHQSLQQICEGDQQQDHRQTQDGVDKGDGEGIHDLAGKAEAEDGVGHIEDGGADGDADDLRHQIDQGGPFAVGAGAQGGE